MAAPTVTTQAISDIGAKVALGNGTVAADGGKTITERGVCLKTSAGPTITDTCFTTTGTTGVFSVLITGRVKTTKYYVKAYATNADGTGYGAEVNFTTGTPLGLGKLKALGVV